MKSKKDVIEDLTPEELELINLNPWADDPEHEGPLIEWYQKGPDEISWDDLYSIAWKQMLEILELGHQVAHLSMHQNPRYKNIDKDRNGFIASLIPDQGEAFPTDEEIAKKAGVTVLVVRRIRKSMNIKKRPGRPKK